MLYVGAPPGGMLAGALCEPMAQTASRSPHGPPQPLSARGFGLAGQERMSGTKTPQGKTNSLSHRENKLLLPTKAPGNSGPPSASHQNGSDPHVLVRGVTGSTDALAQAAEPAPSSVHSGV